MSEQQRLAPSETDSVAQDMRPSVKGGQRDALQRGALAGEAVLSKMGAGKGSRPSLILDANRAAIREAVRRYPLANPRVFGSVLHGTDTERSDVDILVDALPGASLFDLGGLEEDLKALLGIKVDVLTPGFLSKRFREEVLAEAQPI